MSVLDSIQTTVPLAPRITIYGKPGIGKTTLAASFPDPLFIFTENAGIDGVKAFPVIKNYQSICDIANELMATKELPFKTLVIDSLSQLDLTVVDHILKTERQQSSKFPPTLSNVGTGYGYGYQLAQKYHRNLKKRFDVLQRRGITVIYIGHLTTSKFKAPDQDDFDMYNIVMNHDKSREVYIDDVDAVLFCRTETEVISDFKGSKLKNHSGKRIIESSVTPGCVSKNRFKMPEQIPMSFEEIKKYVPFYQDN